MVDENDLKDWGFESTEMFFDHIIDTCTSMDFARTDDMVGMLSPKQKRDFLAYLNGIHRTYNEDIQYCFDKTLLSI